MHNLSAELIPTRATLLLRLKDLEDQASWRDFFDTYWALIYGIALKGGLNPTEAQDVVQETMISVAKHMPGFKYDPAVGSFKAWLLQMTRWRITDQLRKRGRRGVAEEFNDELSAECETHAIDPDLEAVWDAEWESNLLRAAVAKARRRLDPKLYQIFDCYVNKNWPPQKVADSLSVSIGQVYLAKHRVAEAIKMEVERLKKEMV